MIIRSSAPGRPVHLPPGSGSAWPGERLSSFSRLRVNYLLWLLLVITNLTDVLASKHALAHGATELNPIVALLLEAHGITGLVVFKGVWLVALLVLVPLIKGWVQWLFVLVSMAYVLLAVYHLYHL